MPPTPPLTALDASFDALDAIDTIGKMLTASHFDPDALLQAITDVTVRTMRIKGCVLRLLNQDTGELGIRSVTGLSERFLFAAPVIDIKSRFHVTIRQNGYYTLSNVRKGKDLQFSEAALDEGIASLLAVGLFKDRKVIGSLSVYTATPLRFTKAHIQTLRVLAHYAVLAIEMARLYRQELQNELRSRDLAIAGGIQQRMLPAAVPTVEGIDLAVRMNAWYEIGGDFYDITHSDDEMLRIAIGDVAGKGMPAALLLSSVLMAFRSQLYDTRQLPEVVQRVNGLLTRDSRVEEFATLFCCRLDLDEYILSYVNAGHPPPLLFKKGKTRLLKTGGMPIGIRDPLAFEQGVVQLEQGDVLLIRTNGFTEVTNAKGERFGERRLRRVVRTHRQASATRIVDALHAEVRAFAGPTGIRDDCTALVLRIL